MLSISYVINLYLCVTSNLMSSISKSKGLVSKSIDGIWFMIGCKIKSTRALIFLFYELQVLVIGRPGGILLYFL